MKTIKISLFVILQFFVFAAFGQTRVMVKTYDDFQLLKHIDAGGRKNYLSESDIDGSPYLNNEFVKGEVLTENDVRYVGIPLRYNIYSDDIEFKTSSGQVLSIAFPGNIKEVKIGHDVFVYHLYFLSADRLNWGYFQLINTGKAEGLIGYRIIFQEAQPALAYKDPQPPKFIPQPPYYFVSVDKKPAVRVQTTKYLINLLGDHKKELESFAKKNHIKVRKLDDLRRILYYYNSLVEMKN
ncbi:MAG: hypothetical protein IH595_02455 [Bacteroidales bacterium]|nr:hypothetical protein [Bacteroidales bacterium]